MIWIYLLAWVLIGCLLLSMSDDTAGTLYKWANSAPEPWTSPFYILVVLTRPIPLWYWLTRWRR